MQVLTNKLKFIKVYIHLIRKCLKYIITNDEFFKKVYQNF